MDDGSGKFDIYKGEESFDALKNFIKKETACDENSDYLLILMEKNDKNKRFIKIVEK